MNLEDFVSWRLALQHFELFPSLKRERVRRAAAGYLQAAEADHAVHHLADAETVAEVVEGVVLVVVVDTQLEEEKHCGRKGFYANKSLRMWLVHFVSPAISSAWWGWCWSLWPGPGHGTCVPDSSASGGTSGPLTFSLGICTTIWTSNSGNKQQTAPNVRDYRLRFVRIVGIQSVLIAPWWLAANELISSSHSMSSDGPKWKHSSHRINFSQRW